MTLVVRLFVQKAPILIGDLMLSALQLPGEGPVLPTTPIKPIAQPNNVSSNEKTMRHVWLPAGLAQKLAILSSNVALGWAGRHDVAQEVFSQLKSRCLDHEMRAEEFEKLLHDIPASAQEHINFVGYLTSGTNAFRFSFGNYIETLPTSMYGELAMVGTGVESFKACLDRVPIYEARDLGEDNNPTVLPWSINTISMLLSEQLAGDHPEGSHFGEGYEIIFNEANTFKKVGDLSVFFWKAHVDLKDNVVELSNTPLFGFCFQYWKDILIVRVIQIESVDGSNHTFSDRNFAIPPIYREISTEEEGSILQNLASIEGQYLSNIISVSKSDEDGFYTNSLVTKPMSNWIKVREPDANTLDVSINSRLHQRIVNSIVERFNLS